MRRTVRRLVRRRPRHAYGADAGRGDEESTHRARRRTARPSHRSRPRRSYRPGPPPTSAQPPPPASRTPSPPSGRDRPHRRSLPPSRTSCHRPDQSHSHPRSPTPPSPRPVPPCLILPAFVYGPPLVRAARTSEPATYAPLRQAHVRKGRLWRRGASGSPTPSGGSCPAPGARHRERSCHTPRCHSQSLGHGGVVSGPQPGCRCGAGGGRAGDGTVGAGGGGAADVHLRSSRSGTRCGSPRCSTAGSTSRTSTVGRSNSR